MSVAVFNHWSSCASSLLPLYLYLLVLATIYCKGKHLCVRPLIYSIVFFSRPIQILQLLASNKLFVESGESKNAKPSN